MKAQYNFLTQTIHNAARIAKPFIDVWAAPIEKPAERVEKIFEPRKILVYKLGSNFAT